MPGKSAEKDLLVFSAGSPDIIKIITAHNRAAVQTGGVRYRIRAFLDIEDNKVGESFFGFDVLDERKFNHPNYGNAAVAVSVAGSMIFRYRLVQSIYGYGYEDWPVLVHPNVDMNMVHAERGCLVNNGCVIGPGAHFGEQCVLLMGANVNHECEIGAFSFIGPGAIVLGRATTGK